MLLFIAWGYLVFSIGLRWYLYDLHEHLEGDYAAFDIFYLKTHVHLDGLILGSLLGYSQTKVEQYEIWSRKLQPLILVLFVLFP